MAPMIDMVFLLLVFFMTASAASQAGNKLELDLPEAPSSKVPKDLSNRLIVSIDAEGVQHIGRAPVDDEELRERLLAFREEQPRVKLNIRADRSTEFVHVKRVMELASESGIESYLYATFEGGE